jgi:hypothetical protein
MMEDLTMACRACFLALLVAAVSAGNALACQGSTLILDESFKSPESGWDSADEHLSYGAAGAVISLPKGKAYYTFNRHFTSDGTDLCATLLWPRTGRIGATDSAARIGAIDSGGQPNEPEGTAGLAFWAKDYRNYYLVQISNNGEFIIQRQIGNTRHMLSTITDSPLVNKNPGGKNEIEAQISGVKAVFFLNGKKVADFSGQPPPGSGFVGLFASYRGDETSGTMLTFTFPSFRIATYP